MIFLVGARRSGTNWLQRILSSHQGVVSMPSETYLFSHGIEPLTERFQHANPGSPVMGRTFMERERFLDSVRDFVDQVFLDNLERLGADTRYLLERTPWHASHLDLIADVYPDARVIHIIRDGRAVARSLLSMHWGPETMAEAAEEWRAAVEDGRRGGEALGSRYTEVNYEHLLADPRRGIGELFGWLGLDLDEQTWTRILVEAASEFNVDPGAPGVAADKWREELSSADLRVFDRIAGEQLEACGYRRADAESAARTGLSARLQRLHPQRVRYWPARWRPRTAARAAVSRAYSRNSRRVLAEKHGVVERFERMVADGRLDRANAILSPHARIRIVDGGESFDGRGDAAAEKLLSALDEHRLRGLRPLFGNLHASAGLFTTVIGYELDDGSRWTRTLVLDIAYPRIGSIAMYRHPLAVQADVTSSEVAASSDWVTAARDEDGSASHA
jgi:hypothetical protein